MHYTKSENFDEFQCIADKCPKNCCRGWQIMIDEDSLKEYANTKDAFGGVLRTGIDFENSCFKQYENRRCSMLNKDGLCDLQIHMGEEALCQTCTRYPRHVEEFEGEREFSLSLSCPEAARIMLTHKNHLKFIDWEDDIEEDYDDYEEFDDLLYMKLLDARPVFFQMIQNDNWTAANQMSGMLQFAKELQECLDEGRFFEMDDVIEDWRQRSFLENLTFESKWDFDTEKRLFSKLFELETLEADWMDRVTTTWEFMFKEKTFDALLSTTSTYLLKDKEARTEDTKVAAEQLLMFFIYTYFCGAVYDDRIFSKVALAVYSVRWIFFINQALNSKEDQSEDLIKTSYLYAREIEHSDINVEDLEEWFERVLL